MGDLTTIEELRRNYPNLQNRKKTFPDLGLQEYEECANQTADFYSPVKVTTLFLDAVKGLYKKLF